MIARTGDCCWRSRASKVRPSITGMLMSSNKRSMSGSADSIASASAPLRAKRKTNSCSRTWRRKRWVSSSSKSGSSSTARILALMPCSAWQRNWQGNFARPPSRRGADRADRPCPTRRRHSPTLAQIMRLNLDAKMAVPRSPGRHRRSGPSRRLDYSLACRPLHPPQADRELGELAERAVDLDRSAMLLGDDVIADRQAEAGAFAGRLGREEGLEQSLAELGGNAGAVVAHPDLDLVAELPRRDLERRAERRVRRFAAALGRGIEAIAEEVEQNPRHVLRHQLDGRGTTIKIALQG